MEEENFGWKLIFGGVCMLMFMLMFIGALIAFIFTWTEFSFSHAMIVFGCLIFVRGVFLDSFYCQNAIVKRQDAVIKKQDLIIEKVILEMIGGAKKEDPSETTENINS